ncbi:MULTISPECIES: hypothetical protein [unclassified Bradyrhizobium]|uniref:hypothetical protein n=1 Tax=unclassified Bradyrhizobium TaxID=2631580 RepID=UPI00247A9892|nr:MULTISPECIES: hypothetical protein [unclassified Bradyrhizobium]WGS20186.1 hypothetical protein MTX22_38860 [Bradyrhizobium sp. ISRA463]WGS27049.1 hypothetical protein MTX19_36285 [Bradyrhizobium sp. ISRA464]
MKVITIMEEGERARSVYVRTDGDVTVFDRHRKFRFRTDISGAETTWQILERVVPAIVHAETARLKIEALADRCRTGWRPGYPDEIDPDIPQRALRRAQFGIDLIRYPDHDEFYSPATILMGIEMGTGPSTSLVGKSDGTVCVTGEILWIDAAREWAICEDGFWWTPAED